LGKPPSFSICFHISLDFFAILSFVRLCSGLTAGASRRLAYARCGGSQKIAMSGTPDPVKRISGWLAAARRQAGAFSLAKSPSI